MSRQTPGARACKFLPAQYRAARTVRIGDELANAAGIWQVVTGIEETATTRRFTFTNGRTFVAGLSQQVEHRRQPSAARVAEGG